MIFREKRVFEGHGIIAAEEKKKKAERFEDLGGCSVNSWHGQIRCSRSRDSISMSEAN